MSARTRTCLSATETARIPVQERIRMNSTPEPNTGCWLWDRYINPAGYAMAAFGGRTRRVARVAFEAWHGLIPEGLTIDHTCNLPACVNPAHLRAVSMRVNVLRGTSPSSIASRKTHCVNGHPFTAHRDNRGWRPCLPCRRDRRNAKKEIGR